jgi:hypothetical protein
MKNLGRWGSILAGLLILQGCASIRYVEPGWSSEQRQYLDAAMKQPLTFELAKDKSDEAWSRAQVILAHICPLKLQMATDSVIFTYADTENYSWRITREDRGRTSLFDVTCIKYKPGHHDCQQLQVTDRNAHLVAWFMASGARMPDEVVWASLRPFDEISEVTWNPLRWGAINDPWGDFECGETGAFLPPPDLPDVALDARVSVFSNKGGGAGKALIKPMVANATQVRSWSLTIYDASSRHAELRVLGGNGGPPSLLEWDGRDANGEPVAEGIYPAMLRVLYWNGQSIESKEVRLEVTNRYPDLSFERGLGSIDPSRPDLLIMPGEFRIEPASSRLPCRYRLEIRWQNGTLVRVLEGAVAPHLKVLWDGKDAQGGAFISNTRYSFKLLQLDEQGQVVHEYPERTWNCVFLH